MAAPSLDEIAGRYAQRGVGSVFVYTHEAHPAENYPHLTSMEQKFQHARDLRELLGVRSRMGKRSSPSTRIVGQPSKDSSAGLEPAAF